ncbi:MAG: carbohydrate kinase family protein [Thermoleophilia bacterium]
MSHPAPGAWPAAPHALRPIVVVGDVMTDVLACHALPLAMGSDTPARVVTRVGGAGANTAAWLGALRAEVVFHGCVGDDPLGRVATDALLGLGVTARLRVTAEAPTGTCVVLVDGAAERTMLPDHGANDHLGAPAVHADGGHLHLSGYTLLHPGSRESGRAVLAAAREAGMGVSVDPASAAMVEAVGAGWMRDQIRGAHLVVLNRLEGRALTGSDDAAGIAARLLDNDHRAVVVKLGAGGAVWFAAGADPVHVPAATPPGPVVDTTGAGDAFAAGLLAALQLGAGSEAALARACEVAAGVCAQEGAWPEEARATSASRTQAANPAREPSAPS